MVTVDEAVETVVVSRLPLGALVATAAVAFIVSVIADRPAELVKNARVLGSVKVVVDVSVSTMGGNVTVSVAEPNGPACMGSDESVLVGCEIGWLRPAIWKLPEVRAVITVDDVSLWFCDVMSLSIVLV
jgi:hypothetical protein